MNFIGIDLGSRNIKLVTISVQGQLLSKKMFDSVHFYKHYGELSNGQFKLNLKKLDIQPEDKIVSTGYGKHQVNIQQAEKISEQKAHVFGAIHQTSLKSFILLDIGGQDTKIVQVENKHILDIYMNDKCGACSGRYLENMANILQMSIEELGQYAEDFVPVSNTCAIFGESELLGKIFEGIAIPRLAAGINYSIFSRIKSNLIRYIDYGVPIIFTGGVALNKALQNIIHKETGLEVIIPKEPQFNGALGAAVSKISLQTKA
ncbi:MAG: acyl-CoA dehydratase activase [Candidatus Margulisbacteria bacterium]|nr:acyl-CoA dehydratase activase [Candidatus Margulisiibacteriota bacterium]